MQKLACTKECRQREVDAAVAATTRYASVATTTEISQIQTKQNSINFNRRNPIML
jgi:hypothetical protein